MIWFIIVVFQLMQIKILKCLEDLMNSYKKNRNLLTNLTSLKINLGVSVVSYISLEKYILEYININSPALEEKFLFSDLQIILERILAILIIVFQIFFLISI